MTCANEGYARRASALRLDVKGADVRTALAAAKVSCLLLKGRAFAELLYSDGVERPYSDCDLLVNPSSRDRANAVLADLDFVAKDHAPHSRAWLREADGVWVDLHFSLPQLEADPAHVWATLSRRATSMTVGGSPTQVLDTAATALLAALHLVHHGPHAHTPREDLTRAINLLGDECWREAAELARELDASAPLGTGLRLIPAGVALAERLNLPWAPSARALLHWRGAPWGATVWESLASAPNSRARAVLLAEFLAPRSDFLRERSTLARRGRSGLVLAYSLRPFRLAIMAALSYGPWRRARLVPTEPGAD